MSVERDTSYSLMKLDNSAIRELAQKFMREESHNQECLAAQWILQNPDKNIADYTFVFRRTYDEGCFEFSIEAREKHK